MMAVGQYLCQNRVLLTVRCFRYVGWFRIVGKPSCSSSVSCSCILCLFAHFIEMVQCLYQKFYFRSHFSLFTN